MMSNSDNYRLVSRNHRKEDTVLCLGNVKIGGDHSPVIMAGPCAVESEEQVHTIAKRIAAAGVRIMRGGAYKPRTSPYSFQGIGEVGLKWLSSAAKANGMLVVTELMDWDDVSVVTAHADLIQIGSRNMMNYSLLKKLAPLGKAVLLKRGMMARIDELLMAAEYLYAGGTKDVVLCERGIRTFDNATRNTLDIAAVPILKGMTHLPVIVDPSHAAGRSDIVPALSRAAIAVGADGLLVEVAVKPQDCLSDEEQALDLDDFDTLMKDIQHISSCVRGKIE